MNDEFHHLIKFNYTLDPVALKSELKLISSDGVSQLIITSCPSTYDACKSISQDFFLTSLKKFPKLAVLRVQITEELKIEQLERPRVRDFSEFESILIVFESTEVESQKVLFKRNKNVCDFLIVDLTRKNVTGTVAKAAVSLMTENAEIGFNDCRFCTSYGNELALVHLIDHRGRNLLMRAVDIDNLELVIELLQHPFDVHYEIKRGGRFIKAADIAWSRQRNDILLALLKANSPFPDDYDKSKAPTDIKDFLKIGEEMREAIRSQDLRKVTKLMESNRHLCYFFDSGNFTAAYYALYYKNHEMYALLLKHGVTLAPDDFLEIPGNDRQFKDNISSLNAKAALSLPDHHIQVLLANSIISHSDNLFSSANRLIPIREMLDDLDIEEVPQAVLKTAASARMKIRIFFDPTCTGVEHINPPLKQNVAVNGLFNARQMVIYIGAKDLFVDNRKRKVYGTFIHELDHLCNELVFRNERLPYAIDDTEGAAEFERVLEECRIQKHSEKIVGDVFENYKKNDCLKRELIVRVPQMIAVYRKNREKLQEKRQTFWRLFNFFEERVMPAMLRSVPVIERLMNEAVDITFEELTVELKAKVLHSVANFQGHSVKLRDILGSDDAGCLNSSQLREILCDGYAMKIGKAAENLRFYFEREFVESSVDTSERSLINNLNQGIITVLWAKEVKASAKSFDEIAHHKLILLSDQAGMGKSTTFQHLSVKLKEKFKDFWVCYIDLKRNLGVYKKYNDIILVKRRVLEVLIEILKLGDFEREIFTKLFMTNRVVALLDGVDEIAPKYKKFFLMFANVFKEQTDNHMWISTRPQHTAELQAVLGGLSLKHLPYDQVQLHEFLKQYLTKIWKVEEEEEAIKTILKVFYCTRTDLKDSMHTPQSPLMITLIVDMCKSRGETIQSSNLYLMYQSILDTRKEIMNDEKGPIVNASRDTDSKVSIWEIHQLYALKLIFSEAYTDHNDMSSKLGQIDIKKLKIFKRWQKEKSKWSTEAISRYGLLNVDNWDTDEEFPDFSHRTFAEFFVSKFFIENIFEPTEDDDDDLNSNEIELMLRMMLSKIDYHVEFMATTVIARFLTSFLEVAQKSSSFSLHILNYFKSKSYIDFVKTLDLRNDDRWYSMKFFFLLHFFRSDRNIVRALLFADETPTLFHIFFTEDTDPNHLMAIAGISNRVFGDKSWEVTGYMAKKFRTIEFAEMDEMLSDFIPTYDDEKLKNQPGINIEDCRMFLHLMNFIENCEIPQEDLEAFVRCHFYLIYQVCINSSTIADKCFNLLEKMYGNKKLVLFSIFKFTCIETHFYDDIVSFGESKTYLASRKMILKRFEDFFANQLDLKKGIFLNYREKGDHPLISAHFFGGPKVETFFAKNFTSEEIQDVYLEYFHEFDELENMLSVFNFNSVEAPLRSAFLLSKNETGRKKFQTFLTKEFKGHSSLFEYLIEQIFATKHKRADDIEGYINTLQILGRLFTEAFSESEFNEMIQKIGQKYQINQSLILNEINSHSACSDVDDY